MQIRPVEAEFSMRKDGLTDGRTDGRTDRQTDRHDEANGLFCNFADAPKNHSPGATLVQW
jgi:hypothetical protein